MKKSIFLILVGLLGILPISAQNKTDNQYADAPKVDYCELRKNPEFYNGKIIRVHGIYEYEFEVSTFYDKVCLEDSYYSRRETWIWMFFQKEIRSDKRHHK